MAKTPERKSKADRAGKRSKVRIRKGGRVVVVVEGKPASKQRKGVDENAGKE